MRRCSLLFVLGLLFLVNCGKSEKKQQAKETRTQSEVLYSKFCKGCHGKDGTLMFSGASDLSISKLNDVETILMIQEGKDKMPGYEKVLKEEEIILLAVYVKGLRKIN